MPSASEYLPCYFRTKTGAMSTRLIQIDGQTLYFCQEKNNKVTNKLEIDLQKALVVLGLPSRTQWTNFSSGKVDYGFIDYPISIRFEKKRLTLHFLFEADRTNIMDLILKAQGRAT